MRTDIRRLHLFQDYQPQLPVDSHCSAPDGDTEFYAIENEALEE